MSIKCKLGLHTWNGCKCKDCYKYRDEQHHWIGCRCSQCGKTRDEQHAWSKDCEKCSICGKTRDKQHDWNGCKCSMCEKTRDEQHNLEKDCEKCSICGKIKANQHDYKIHIAKCSKCGKELNKGSFLDNRDGRRYKWIRIGNQIIMAENFAYKPDNGKYWAYEDSYTLSEDTVAKFGYLYDWETANKVAPDGWHLPTKEEWLALFSDFKKFLYKEFYVEWKYLPEKEDGTKYTLFGGMYNHRNGCCSYGNGQSFFWSSTEVDGELAFGLYIPERTSEDIPGIKYNRRGDGLSVILFQD